MWNLWVTLRNNTTCIFGYSDYADPKHLNHSWAQFVSGFGESHEKRQYVVNTLLAVFDCKPPYPLVQDSFPDLPAVGGVGQGSSSSQRSKGPHRPDLDSSVHAAKAAVSSGRARLPGAKLRGSLEKGRPPPPPMPERPPPRPERPPPPPKSLPELPPQQQQQQEQEQQAAVGAQQQQQQQQQQQESWGAKAALQLPPLLVVVIHVFKTR